MMSNAELAKQAYEAWLKGPTFPTDREPMPEGDRHEWFERACLNCFTAGYLVTAGRLVEAEKALREIANDTPTVTVEGANHVRIAHAYFASHDLPKGDVK